MLQPTESEGIGTGFLGLTSREQPLLAELSAMAKGYLFSLEKGPEISSLFIFSLDF